MLANSSRREEIQKERIPLHTATSHILEECRMVLPGIQALFGFQLIAVFSEGFPRRLSTTEQELHFASILLVVASIVLVMAPAALHRQAEPRSVSERFIRVSSRLLLWGMMLLSLGISLEVYLVGQTILENETWAAAVAAGAFLLFVLFWVGLPFLERRKRQA
jgi:hypothetical protein